ncbi:MAG: Fic family protein [Methanomassiliicoccales archaeon]|nr:Fic family protein [Methanomassiliicoccales archaeon]
MMLNDILDELRSTLLDRANLRSLPESVWKQVAILNTWGTNSIEGNTLSLEEVRVVLEAQRSVPGRPIRDVIETVQHEAAFRGLLLRLDAPITLVTVKELHEQVFRGIKVDAGQWRRVNVRIAGSKHTPPRLEKVVVEMEKWERAYDQKDRDGTNVFALAAQMHSEFERIHAFSDGNGRVGRLLLNLHFLKHNWPPVSVTPIERKRYLDALEKADDGDPRELEALLRVLMASSLLALLDQVGTAEDALVPLRELEKGADRSAKYLSLRAGQGYLPAVKRKGDWLSSKRALRLYDQYHARG